MSVNATIALSGVVSEKDISVQNLIIITPNSDGSEPVDIASQLDGTTKLLNRLEIVAVDAILDSLHTTQISRFTRHTHYRWHAIKGHAHRLRGELTKAAEQYLLSRDFRPDLDKARCLEVLAHHILGDDERARILAERLVIDCPNNDSARALWIQVSSAESLDDVIKATPPHLRSNEEVAVALAIAALQRGRFDEATAFAGDAVKCGSDWIQCKGVLAVATAQKFRSRFEGHVGQPLLSESDQAELRNCLSLAEEVLKKLSPDGEPTEIVKLRLASSIAHSLLGDVSKSKENLSEALRLRPQDDQVILMMAEWIQRNESISAAAAFLEGIPQFESSIYLRLALGQYSAGIDKPEAQARSTKLLEDLLPRILEFNSVSRYGLMVNLITGYTSQKEYDKATSLLESENIKFLPLVIQIVLKGDLAIARGDASAALELANKAKSQITNDSEHLL